MNKNGKLSAAAIPASKRRVALLDELRGVSVFCMVFYHGFYIAGHYFGVRIFDSLYAFFLPVQPFFASLFIVICGVSSRLSRSNLRRGLRLLAIAVALSLFTVYVCPLVGIEDAQILFGILHLLSVSILIFACVGPFSDKINPAVGAAVCLLLYAVTYSVPRGFLYLPFHAVALPESLYTHDFLSPLGFQTADFYSADYFPLLPNVFMFLAGSFCGAYVRDGKIPGTFYDRHIPFLDKLGKLSLPVYILHWPVIYIVLSTIVKLSERF